MQKTLIVIIDSFYFLFKRFLPLKTYRYAVCGGSNVVLDMCLYFLCYNFVLAKHNVDLQLVVLSPHIASLFFVFPITFMTGFALNKYITFQESNLPGRIQLIRYLLVGLSGFVLSYFCMKLLVDVLHFYPTPSRFITIIIAVIYSYILQNKFSFKVKTDV
ncbi:MAG: phenylalanine 4-monooxygenase [Flavobacteriales bacterium CG_4_9_14_3_um_filter_32_8]|nr:MAG: phenylalanine 4-monooxygenase [Flavobacteriales bacterium CG_4_9_14_3_um_filter_32_8]